MSIYVCRFVTVIGAFVPDMACIPNGFSSVIRPFKDYFSSYETGQSVGGRKREKAGEPPGTPASRRI